ncbi:MAG TPA: 50S ribosomal protein L24e [Thermoplasmata archaeon]|nr:50S ribosomal protein L24e [Thermoplasmata archaeon]
MVVKRQCSFCAQEIEPGTGSMFVKRDGSVFHFCSGSCRKQQLHLGRVGHRFKWTRAHALKKADERSSATAPAAASAPPHKARPRRQRPPTAAAPVPAAEVTAPAEPTVPAATPPPAPPAAKPRARPKKKADAEPAPKDA